jgi:hypothetical protein
LFPAKANQNGFAFAIKKCEANMKNIKLTQIISLVLTVFLLSENIAVSAQTKRAAQAVKTPSAVQISLINTVLSAAWQSGELPQPLSLPPGNTDEVATILAKKVAAKNSESVAALLTALQLSGFFVTGKGGKVLLAPPDGKGQGLTINGWEIASMAKMLGDGKTTSLAELSGKLKLLEPFKNIEAGEYFLDGIRANAVNKENPFLRIWARFLIELGKNSPAKYDITAKPKQEQVLLDAVQHLLIMRRLYGDLYALSEKYKQPANGINQVNSSENRFAETGVKFINTRFSKQTARYPQFYEEFPSANAQNQQNKPCRMDGDAPTIMDAAATGAGYGFGKLMDYLAEHMGEGAGAAIGKYTQAANLANIVLAYAKFIQTYAALETKIVVDGKSPLVRTKNSIPGGRKNLRAEVRMNLGNWQMYNCIRTVMNFAGIDFATLNDGPLGGIGVTWHLDEGGAGDVYNNREGKTGSEQIVGFAQDNAKRIQDKGKSTGNLTYDKTDDNGIVSIILEGTPQRNVKVGQVMPIMKNAHVRTTIKMKAGEIKGDMVDVIGQALGGIGGLITMPLELLYRSDWISTAEADIPVKDWEECRGTGWHGAISYTRTANENQTENKSYQSVTFQHTVTYEATIEAKPDSQLSKQATFTKPTAKSPQRDSRRRNRCFARRKNKETRRSYKEDFCRFTLKGGTDKTGETVSVS